MSTRAIPPPKLRGASLVRLPKSSRDHQGRHDSAGFRKFLDRDSINRVPKEVQEKAQESSKELTSQDEHWSTSSTPVSETIQPQSKK